MRICSTLSIGNRAQGEPKVTLSWAAVTLALGWGLWKWTAEDSTRSTVDTLGLHQGTCARPVPLEFEGRGWDSWQGSVLAFPLPRCPFAIERPGNQNGHLQVTGGLFRRGYVLMYPHPPR